MNVEMEEEGNNDEKEEVNVISHGWSNFMENNVTVKCQVNEALEESTVVFSEWESADHSPTIH
ncbi:hypothetical protein E2C01_019265 [Portunus trituberculatus]|uniref:Uncharacterized protein n=1 Tax=Portunus trituberculatus TaxID=210409 RepID=A0A5B7DZX9_PORTR|nr:hypothetical protein [Portunus trituberculatus]